jgi:hypothetical protein
MTLSSLVFLAILIASFWGIAYNIRRLYSFMMLGRKESRADHIMARLKRVWVVAFEQTKLMRDPLPGILHLAIYWGFLVFLFAVIESIGEGLFHGFSLHGLGWFYSVISCSQDIFCLLVAAAVVIAYWRRAITKVKRLQVNADHALDATVILLLIFIIVTAYLFQNAAAIAMVGCDPHVVRPVSSAIAAVCFENTMYTAGAYQIFWWVHIITVLGFMNYLPYSKHLHVITSVPNVFFTRLKKPVPLEPINFEQDGIEKFGAMDFEDFTWKQLLDAYTCT